MGCSGCRRKKKSSGSRTKPMTVAKTPPIVQNIFTELTPKELMDRKKKCGNCPFNTLGTLKGRCKKGNRIIDKAVNDPSFKCPIKRF